MRALRIEGPGRVRVTEVPDPEPGPGEVPVRVRAAAVCATDRRMATLGTAAPRIPGHEAAGELPDGTVVGIQPNLGCGRCEWCLRGFENRCPGHDDVGIQRDGALAEVVAVPAAHAVPVEGLPFGLAALVEPLACVVHAISLLDVAEGDAALVVGAGSLGILGTWALQAAGARVAVVQRSEERRRLARELGAHAVLGPEEDPSGPLGAAPRAALVTAPGAEALRVALERVGPGGRVHAFAGTPGGAPIDANVVHYRHLALVGSTGSTLEDYRLALDLVRTGRVPLDRLPRETVTLGRLAEVLVDPAPDPRVLKFIVEP